MQCIEGERFQSPGLCLALLYRVKRPKVINLRQGRVPLYKCVWLCSFILSGGVRRVLYVCRGYVCMRFLQGMG